MKAKFESQRNQAQRNQNYYILADKEMKKQWEHVAVGVVSVGCVSTLLLLFLWRRCCHKEPRQTFIEPNSLHERISGKPVLFNWSDHPSLAVDAVENGWSRFGFTPNMWSPNSKARGVMGLGVICGGCDDERESREAEIRWEVCEGSCEFVQKLRLNPGGGCGLKRVHVIRMALPLPGPPLGNYAFPQEAYFEITVLCGGDGDNYERNGKNSREGEKIKLIQQYNLDGIGNKKNMEEMSKEGGENRESVMFSMGLTSGGCVPLIVPGSYKGSIGFNSEGSVFLDGKKVVVESEKAEWGGSDRVIGCGYDPRQKKVFFTVGSELVHVIQCESEEFGTPLYPTLAANIDITVLVNLGQSEFKYEHANAQRTPNPCFIVNPPNATLGYEDSKELFSMGRIDSQWSTTKVSHNTNTNTNGLMDFDDDSDADLFEIVLDTSGKAPTTPF